MQSGNILQIPFHRTTSTTLSAAIKSYISTKYDQHPSTFARDLEIIDQLRKDAVNAQEPHASGVRKLQAYAAQLVWMGGKFPVDVRSRSPSYVLVLVIGLLILRCSLDRCRFHVVFLVGLLSESAIPCTHREQFAI
jgi:hypothetical protein